MFSKIRYTIANHTQPSGEHVLVPRLKSGNIEEFMDKYDAECKPFTRSTMIGAFYTMRNELVDMMSNGSAIHVPGLGTFMLTLGGGVIEHTRHRSIDNFASNLFAGFIAYNLLPKKPEMNIEIIDKTRLIA